MSTNQDEVLIDEICAELRQLCTELEKVRVVPRKDCDSSILKGQGIICTPDRKGADAQPVQQNNAFKRSG